MKVAFQKEDIQLLSSILQDQLQQEIPSVPVLQVKCAVKNDRLMILTQHPPEVAVDTEEIFTTLEESLQWQSQYHDEKVELYVRFSGEKLPHAKKSITIQAKEVPEKPEIELPEPNNLLDNHQEITQPPELELPEPNNFLDNHQEITQPPEIQSPESNNLLDNHQEITQPPEIQSPEPNNLLDNHQEITQPPELELPEPNNFLDNNVGNNQLIFPPLDIPELSSSFSDENSLENSPFSSLNTDDDISGDSFASLNTDDDISGNSFSSLNTDDDISDDSFASLNNDDSNHPLNTETMLGANTTFVDDLHNNSETIETYDPFGNSENDSEPIDSYDPFADEENSSTNKKPSLPSLPPLPIILGSLLGLIVICGGGAFFLTKACVIGECKELKTAAEIKTQSQQLLSKAKSQPELASLKQKLDQAIVKLNKIPQFSPRSQEAQELSSNFTQQSTKINLVIQALQAASSAEQQSKNPGTSIDELKSRQALWRKAITPLESVKSDPQLGGLAKAKLPQYKNQLETINKELLSEEAWQKKLATAKTVANSTLERQATAKSANDWQRVQFGWQEVINSLKSIPETSTAHQEAEKLLIEYQPRFVLASNRAKREVTGVKTYQQAVNLANQAKIYEKKNQWQAAIASWQQAIETAKQVSQETFSYSQAQSLIKPYSESLVKAQENFQIYGNLVQTRADLSNTCKSRMLFCTFNIENQRIVVRLTPNYDQMLANADTAIQTHFRTLQTALGVISDNAKLPIFLYNSQGEERYMKNPQ